MNKEHLIDELSVRWWYAMPKWPPENFDYTQRLRERGLRKVEIKQWKMEQDDIEGLRKVFELDNFPGVFKDSQGQTYDLRPKETCPSLNNFLKMERGELQKLLFKAYGEQINTLENLEQPYDKQFENDLRVRLKKR